MSGGYSCVGFNVPSIVVTISLRWRDDFIRIYLERDVPQFGPRLPAGVLERLWIMLAHGQATLLNATRLASALQITAPTVQRYIDLLADLLLVRRLQPFHNNAGKRLVKSPKVYIRDSGLVHALLGLKTFKDLAGHPVAGSSWEGFMMENITAAAPERTVASFYRTAAGAEIDLLLEIPGHGLWAIEVKRSLSGRPEKGFYIACHDLKPDKQFVVNAGLESYRTMRIQSRLAYLCSPGCCPLWRFDSSIHRRATALPRSLFHGLLST